MTASITPLDGAMDEIVPRPLMFCAAWDEAPTVADPFVAVIL